jgi:hypothetical protein
MRIMVTSSGPASKQRAYANRTAFPQAADLHQTADEGLGYADSGHLGRRRAKRMRRAKLGGALSKLPLSA